MEEDQEFDLQFLENKSERKYSERGDSYCEGHQMKQNMALYEEL